MIIRLPCSVCSSLYGWIRDAAHAITMDCVKLIRCIQGYYIRPTDYIRHLFCLFCDRLIWQLKKETLFLKSYTRKAKILAKC